MSAGELWNMGIILYTFYHGEFPFKGNSDEEIIENIINRPPNWTPEFRDGLSEQLRNFIMMCFEYDPYKRGDKLPYINHPFILLNQPH
jgi:serine/threonine protein kinase